MKNKIKKTMRKKPYSLALILFVITVCASSVFAQASTAQVRKNVVMNGVTVQKLVKKLASEFDYSFFIVDENVANTAISVNKTNATVPEILNEAFKNKDIAYTVRGKNITISKNDTKIANNTAQRKERISGTVKDANGDPIIGANIIEVGSSGNGTVTDIDGKFALDITSGASIKITYIGYEEQEISTVGKSKFDIVLVENTKALDEVVVIGYGTVAKKDLTGAVASVSNRMFKDQPIKSTSEILQGRTSGVEVTSTSGLPGGGKRVRVRGLTSINKSNDPLYIVDGVEGGSVSPEDIKSIEVLKDASSTAIYGSRGANGVILITTRSGEAGKNKIEFTSFTGFSSFPKKYPVMNAYEYAQALNDIRGAGTISDADVQAYKNGTKGIDWQDLMTQTGIEQDYRVSFSGGTDKLTYRISGNVVDQTAVTITTERKSYYIRSNVDSQITPWLKFYTKINASRTHSHNGGGPNIFTSIAFSPTIELRDEKTGIYNLDPYNSISANPYGSRKVNYDNSYNNSLQLNGNLVFSIIDGLTFSLQGAYNYSGNNSYWFSSKYRAPGETDSMGTGHSVWRSWQNINNLTYAKTFGMHSLTATAVWELKKSEGTWLNGDGTNLANGDMVGYWDITNAASRNVSNGYSGDSMASGLFRVMYNYGGRYFLTASYRADGSSKFSKDNRWSYFPSGAIAWDMAQEKFMKNQKLFQQLKLRASYGVTGNQGIGAYSTLAMLSKESYAWGTENLYTGYWSNTYPATNLRWEKVYQTNIGMDVSMFDSRLNLSLDYFKKQSKDLLFQKTLPGYFGGGGGSSGNGGTTWVNRGQIDNKGFEMTLTAYPLSDVSPVQWETSLTTSYVTNKIIDLAGDDNIQTDIRSDLGGSLRIMKVGKPYGAFYLYHMKGFDENGAYLYEKADGSMVINPTPEKDQRIMGNSFPKWTFGWNNSVRWKNWTVNLFFNGAAGYNRLNQTRYATSSMTGPYRFITLRDAYMKGWDKVSNKADAEFPNYKNGDVKYLYNGDKWLENASFIKLKNMSIAYNFPRKLIRFADLQLSLSGQNLFTITKYKGLDPEGDAIDMGAYPLPRTYTVGVKATF